MASLGGTVVSSSTPSPVSGMSMAEWNRLPSFAKQYYLDRQSKQQAQQQQQSQAQAEAEYQAAIQAIQGGGTGGAAGGAVSTSTTGAPATGGAGTSVTIPGNLQGILGGSYSFQGSGQTSTGATSFDDPLGPSAAESASQYTSSPEYQQYQQAIQASQDAAKQQADFLATLQGQYSELTQRYDERDKQLSGYLQGLGEEERKRLEQRRQQLKAEATQRLIARGASSSTVLDSVLRGIDATADSSLAEMEERLRKQELDYRTQFSGDTLAAQQQVLGFGSAVAQTNFAAATQNAGQMANLAEMLAAQRAQGWSTQTELRAKKLAQGSDVLNYLSSIEGIRAQRATDQERLGLSKYQTDLENKLGYARLQSGLRETALQGQTSTDIAKIQNRTPTVQQNRIFNMG